MSPASHGDHRFRRYGLWDGVFTKGLGRTCNRRHTRCVGRPEGLCITNCFTKLIAWAQQFTFDPEMRFVFDNRTKEVERRARAVFDAFQRWIEKPRLAEISFGSSQKNLHLQAAGMVAWEFYQYANDILANGFVDAKRHQYRRLASNMLWFGQIATRQSIQRIMDYARKQDPEKMKAAARHFTHFDPENPDAL